MRQAHTLDCQSTNFQRTLATLGGALRGLYPEAQHGSGHVPVVSIPVTVRREEDEILYADTGSCPHFHTFFAMAKEIAAGDDSYSCIALGPSWTFDFS